MLYFECNDSLEQFYSLSLLLSYILPTAVFIILFSVIFSSLLSFLLLSPLHFPTMLLGMFLNFKYSIHSINKSMVKNFEKLIEVLSTRLVVVVLSPIYLSFPCLKA